VLADDKIFFCSENGVSVVKATPEKFEELGHFAPAGPPLNLTSPAIAGGKLYLRRADCVVCYDLTAR
jgi:hypothetical protein